MCDPDIVTSGHFFCVSDAANATLNVGLNSVRGWCMLERLLIGNHIVLSQSVLGKAFMTRSNKRSLVARMVLDNIFRRNKQPMRTHAHHSLLRGGLKSPQGRLWVRECLLTLLLKKCH
eukprot:Blabericola_migrator_1__8122@NODE_418_length_8690_cov_78_447872_g330_i0_p10_GENE_NODE_418_length_8690_cov_78_447872_g330_i0NODE_418_length_8690_cov_78_447872_g330_i0_p10_ORF_typecomplete_len118_score3_60_NODE_418_length_8690_cov_78_447872_g330_i010721425